jgi:four helix bundle protein
MEKISSFTQLRTWQSARTLAGLIYKITGNFPSSEQFGLTSQIRRSSVSIAANIAEGFSRSTARDKRHFYTIALGSLTETESHAYIAADIGYLPTAHLEELLQASGDLQKMLRGLMRTADERKAIA